jgi:uncharacterized protein (TIGR03086 family)
MTSVSDGLALLERAVGFALLCASDVTPARLANPTPCTSWDLRALLVHCADSALVLHDAISSGWVSHPIVHPGGQGANALGTRLGPEAAFGAVATQLLGACAVGRVEQRVAVGGRHITVGLAAATGAVELAVHGWDISAACGRRRPIPPGLAGDLLAIASLVVSDATRAGLFRAPVRVPPPGCPGDELVAMLGRSPAA